MIKSVLNVALNVAKSTSRLTVTTRMFSTPAAITSCQDFTLPAVPELCNPRFLDVLLPPKPENVKSLSAFKSNPMMDALRETSCHTLTENMAPTFSSTLSATLDAFQSLGYTFGTNVDSSLSKAWNEDPELTLRVIWNLRSIHDGKSDKEAFYRAFGWLYDNHPRTAISNLYLLVEPVCAISKRKEPASHGYWKDLLNILALATVDQISHIDGPPPLLHVPRCPYTHSKKVKKVATHGAREARISAAEESNARAKAAAKELRSTAATVAHQQLVQKLKTPKYQALYIAVARLFADMLAKDIQTYQQLEALPVGADRIPLIRKISLAAKWAPTPGLFHDRHTNISTAISMLLFNSQVVSFPSALSTSLEPRMHSAILRSFYQRWILRPLREVIEVPEPFMASNRWTDIKYSRVSSVCMKNNTENFYKHDPEGFEKYLMAVESGKKTISGATLFPHELVHQAYRLGLTISALPSGKFPALQAMRKQLAEAQIRVVEAQWKTLVERLREAGSIENAIAVCDVSGSMGIFDGRPLDHVSPIYPAVSLSLILAQLAKPPFNNGFITFSSDPKFVYLDSSKHLYATIGDIVGADWGMNTDLNAVFLKLILPLAIRHGVKKEDMIKRLFIFSDMQFDAGAGTSANPDHWTTNHDVIEKAYQEAGYDMPQIVYWDLGNYGTVPVTADKKGVALMNGFSPAMLKTFMGEDDLVDGWEQIEENGDSKMVTVEQEEFTPINIMKKALSRKSFEGLMVVD